LAPSTDHTGGAGEWVTLGAALEQAEVPITVDRRIAIAAIGFMTRPRII
jgi:hypothetical protein